jgi:hypothetical protein
MNLSSADVPSQFDWSRMGSDLRVIDEDDLTPLTFFIEQWDAGAQTAVVWVLVPSIPGGGRTVFLYFEGPTGTTSVSTPTTFTTPGFQFHTRNSSADAVDRASAETAFDSAPTNRPGYGCAIINAYTNVNNVSVFGPPNRNRDIGLSAEAFFEVTASEAGVWEFRYGADFGRGGGLYVDDIALDEKWNTDLWWAFNWNNAAEILQGSINLGAGYHSLRILGFEGCCDGGLTVQFRRPGESFQAMSLANIAMSSRACAITTEPVVTYGPGEAGACPALSLLLTTQTLTDPINGAVDPKAIPGAIVLNSVAVRNSGNIAVDANSFVVTQPIPTNVSLLVADFDGTTAGPVQLADGVPASGLTYSFLGLASTTDDLEFSSDNGASYAYVPTPGADGSDPAVTDIRISPNGSFAGNTGAGDPSVVFSFKTVVP